MFVFLFLSPLFFTAIYWNIDRLNDTIAGIDFKIILRAGIGGVKEEQMYTQQHWPYNRWRLSDGCVGLLIFLSTSVHCLKMSI